MADLKKWEFVTVDDEGFEKMVHIYPSKKPGYNWTAKVRSGRFHWKTKKSAKENLNRIL